MNIKWAYLNGTQRKQVLDYYEDELKHKKMFEHNLNTRHFRINQNDGNVVFSKGF